MMFRSWIVTSLALVLGATGALIDHPVALRRYDQHSDQYTALTRALHEANLYARDTLQGIKTIDKRWDGAVLLKFTDTRKNATTKVTTEDTIEIVCNKCYVKGLAKAQVQVPSGVNASDIIQQSAQQVKDTVGNLTDAVKNNVAAYVRNATTNMIDMLDGIDDIPDALPQMQFDFNVAVPPAPQVSLDFQFSDLEIYMELDTVLKEKVSYTLNVATTQSMFGVGKGQSQLLGATVTLDLVLSADASINMRSGFHLRFDELGFDVGLFNKTVNNLLHKGGKFEFLPVTIESAGVTLQALLQLTAHVGIVMSTKQYMPTVTIFNSTTDFQFKGGIETKVFANLVDISAGIVYGREDESCKIKFVGGYQLGVGAGAGATVEIHGHTWGPHIEKQTAIWTASRTLCAVSAQPTRTSTTIAKRAGMSTTTTAVKLTYTGVQCQSTTAGGECPASLQQSRRTTTTTTLTTVVPSGAKVVWPETPGVTNTVGATVAFRDDIIRISASSGAPTVFTGTPESGLGGKVSGILGAVDASAEQNKKLVTGLAASIGSVAFIVFASLAAYYIVKRRKQAYAAVQTTPSAEPMLFSAQLHTEYHQPEMYGTVHKPKNTVKVRESQLE